MYALSLCDWLEMQRHPEHAALSMVLQAMIDPQQQVDCEPRKAVGMGTGIVFSCADERVEAIVKLIRTRLKKYQLRIYRKNRSRWQRRRISAPFSPVIFSNPPVPIRSTTPRRARSR